MTFIRKHSGDASKPIIAVYMCPEHGEFDAEVARTEQGEAPDFTPCPVVYGTRNNGDEVTCGLPSDWTPSATIGCRVRRVEVVRGKWEKPERKTFLDTRELGEGQDPEDFAAKRKAIWEEKRKERVMKAIRE